MKTLKFTLLIFLSTCLFLAGCGDQPVNNKNVEEEISLQAEEGDFSLDNLAPSKEELRKLFQSAKAKRKQKGGIVHYQFDVRLGSGPYDVVRIHRVVREHRSFHPKDTRGSIFMVHGSSQGFDDIFLNAGTENPEPETSVAMHLASKGIDVWGIDLAWNFIPEEETDFSFMKNWGVEKDVSHTLAAMSIARFFRGLTGQGFDRMNLLGFSYGGGIAYAAAARETQQPRFFRDIRGIIPVDMPFKRDNVKLKDIDCNAAEAGRAQLNDPDNPVFHNDNRLLSILGNLALDAPNGEYDVPPPPAFPPGILNYQVPLLLGLSPRPVSNWHFLAGEFDLKSLNFELYHTKPVRWYKLLAPLPPYMPKLSGVQLRETACGKNDVSIDDHLSEITIPIFYLGAVGGTGEEGYYTTTLTSSKDITTHTVEAQTAGMEDYGHADLFMAENAPKLVWERLYKWIVGHTDRKRGEPRNR